MRILLILTTIFILSSCASRTKYRPYTPSSDGGYVDKVEKAGDVRISEFYGNSKTSLDDVIALSTFRAIEVCTKEEKKPIIISHNNLSEHRQIQRSSTSTYTPTESISGNINTNSYGSNDYADVNLQKEGGFGFSGTSSWTETIVIPSYQVKYFCGENYKTIGIQASPISKDVISKFTKDFEDAVIIKHISNNSPNQGILQKGDVIIQINNHRIEDLEDLALQINQSKVSKATSTILRKGEFKKVLLKIKSDKVKIEDFSKLLEVACARRETRSHKACEKLLGEAGYSITGTPY